MWTSHMIITCNIVIGMLSSFLKFRIWCSHVKIGIWFHMWTFLIFTCDVFVYDVHIWCSHMMLRYMMFTYDITYEVWYMISHVNLVEDHIRFSHEMMLYSGRSWAESWDASWRFRAMGQYVCYSYVLCSRWEVRNIIWGPTMWVPNCTQEKLLCPRL